MDEEAKTNLNVLTHEIHTTLFFCFCLEKCAPRNKIHMRINSRGFYKVFGF